MLASLHLWFLYLYLFAWIYRDVFLPSIYFVWRREWQSTPVFSPGEFHGQRSLVSYSPWSRKESASVEQLTLHLLSNFSRQHNECYRTQVWLFTAPHLTNTSNASSPPPPWAVGFLNKVPIPCPNTLSLNWLACCIMWGLMHPKYVEW